MVTVLARELPPDMSWRLNAPNVAGMGEISREQVLWARGGREPHERTRCPQPGDIVWMRMHAHGPLLEAAVEAVLEDEGDPNTHRFVIEDCLVDGLPTRRPKVDAFGHRLRELVEDPWWLLRIKIVDPHGAVAFIEAREARLDGAPGWLPREEK